MRTPVPFPRRAVVIACILAAFLLPVRRAHGQADPAKEIRDPNDGIYIRYPFSGYTVTSQVRPTEFKGDATATPVRASGIIRISMPGITITQGSVAAKGVIGMSTLQNLQWPPKGD
jgi:hypothetical protein